MKTFSDFGITLDSRASGAEQNTTCPQCSSSRKKRKAKCLSVNIDKGCWKCHHCGWTGSLYSRQFDNIAKVKIEYNNSTHIPDHILKWFAERGIPQEILKRNGITVGNVYMPQVDAKVETIQFPFFQKRNVVNIKYRTLDKQFRQYKGAPKILYGLDDVSDVTIITEGEMDKLAMEVAGFTNCVSVPDGAPPANAKEYSSKFEYLENCKEELAGVKKFILAVDADEPGRRLEEELARRLGIERCYRVFWPEGSKDANDVLTKLGVESLRSLVKSAKPYPISGIYEPDDISDKIDTLYQSGLSPGEHPGWDSLAHFYTIKPGELTLITGIPSHGKSEFIDALMINLAEGLGWHFGIFSPENQPLERHGAKLLEKHLKKPFAHGKHNRMTYAELQQGKNWLNQHFAFLLPKEEEPITVDAILKLAKTMVYRYGSRGLVIDPWNEMDHSRPHTQTETEYISASLAKIRQFARSYGVHVWLVAHPTKLLKKANGDYPVPSPYDIAGSAHWRNKADNCIAVWRSFDNDDNTVEIHVQKVRFKEIGKLGVVGLAYDIDTGLYSDN